MKTYNVVGIVDEFGYLAAWYEYDSFGATKVQEDPTRRVGHINSFRWKKHYYDEETGE